MTVKKEILDELIKDYRNPEDLLGENGLLKQLTKQLLERAMQAELTEMVKLFGSSALLVQATCNLCQY
jgi:putative transposase